MQLYLQLGHGMKEHSIELNTRWGGTTSILSPKNMDVNQLTTISSQLQNVNGKVLLDPQFYFPRTSHENLQNHEFWPQDYDTNSFFSGSGLADMLNILVDKYILPLNTSAFIVPGLFSSEINDDWLALNNRMLDAVIKKGINQKKYLTLCLSNDIIMNEEQIHTLLDYLEDFSIDGVYLIGQHPNSQYLIDNANWLLNFADLCAGLKIQKKEVIVGYANQQMLYLALAKVDALCAGTWQKTRMFPTGDFDESDDDQEGGRRSTWYYCPPALSEYQIAFLDVANRAGVLTELKTPDNFPSNYADILFSGAQPSSVNFSEREAFRHFLDCLRFQCQQVSLSTFSDTKKILRLLFETSLDLTSYFRQNGIRGKHRDFNDVAETTNSVLDSFENLRGLLFGHSWNKL